ncbi:MAG: type II toxin-antitoxin system PemK/MazF family toxin [Armatimonadetes bacterium]|nr:type II toxin-antitoxin system PemK/MazF family toxin [Armatimonadota bacterium]
MRFVREGIVVTPFPFSGATGEKPRPALVLASWSYAGDTDYLLCMIISQQADEPYIIALDIADIENGSLRRKSYLRPSYMFAVSERRISRKLGSLTSDKLELTIEIIKGILE